jgi:hypothetical protein
MIIVGIEGEAAGSPSSTSLSPDASMSTSFKCAASGVEERAENAIDRAG